MQAAGPPPSGLTDTTTRDPALGTTTVVVSAPIADPSVVRTSDDIAAGHNERWSLLTVQKRCAPKGHRLTMCMMPIIGQRDGRAGVELVGYQDTLGGRQVTIKGAARCGDKSCVICSTKISEGLAAEIEGVARRWLAGLSAHGGG